MRELLAPYGIEAVSAGELGLPEPEETGADFVANALIKARAAAKGAGLPALADDSGLCVEALGGAPGILFGALGGRNQGFRRRHGADRAGGQDNQARRRAGRISSAALAVAWPDGVDRSSRARSSAILPFRPRGSRGFGYDPCFTPDGHARTFGEMSAEEKHGVPADGSEALSHRARAFQMLARALLTPS